MQERWRHWHYKNTALLLVSLGVFWYFAETPLLKATIERVGSFGYLSAVIVGMLFVSTFTVAPAAVVLFNLAAQYHPLALALLAGAGAMVGDYLMLRFVKDRVYDELQPLFMRLGGSHLAALAKTPFFAWLMPVFGAIVIASPLPDELGISILGLTRIQTWRFLVLSFVLNAGGILLIITLAQIWN